MVPWELGSVFKDSHFCTSKCRLPFALVLICAFILPACNAGGKNELLLESENGALIYAALNPVTRELQARVDTFNANHEDARIEIRDYSDEGGIERFRLELMAGRVPDIMELHRHAWFENEYGTWDATSFGISLDADLGSPRNHNQVDMTADYWMPYRQLVQKGYLEDLWPYIENDPELGREAVLEVPLKAAEVNGGLYMLFKEFSISTLIGPERIVGNRYGWTLEELMESFSAMPDGSSILRYDAVRSDVFSNLIAPTLNRYVDWETGQCSFDSGEFRNLLGFLKSFPEENKSFLSNEDRQDEVIWRILHGQQMLTPVTISWLSDIPYEDTYFGETAAYVGYPTADGSFGSSFLLQGDVLAVSSACEDKEAAWDFVRQLITRKYNYNAMKKTRRYRSLAIPVNRKDYEMGNRVDMVLLQQVFDITQDVGDFPPDIRFSPAANGSGIKVPLDVATERDLQRFEALINNTTQLYWPDDTLSDIVWEAAGPYFAGDKTMDETIALVQDRVTLYINEQK